MENSDWYWWQKNIKKKEEKRNELWTIWWTICTTRTKRKIKPNIKKI